MITKTLEERANLKRLKIAHKELQTRTYGAKTGRIRLIKQMMDAPCNYNVRLIV